MTKRLFESASSFFQAAILVQLLAAAAFMASALLRCVDTALVWARVPGSVDSQCRFPDERLYRIFPLRNGGFPMKTVSQLAGQLKKTYGSQRDYSVPSENISLTDTGYLETGKNGFHVPFNSLDELAEWACIPKPFHRELPPDLQSSLFNGCWQRAISDGKLPRRIRVRLDGEKRFIGFDDRQLLRVSPPRFVELLEDSLPQGLSSEQIEVARCDPTPRRLWLSFFSPDIEDQPRPGDIINGRIAGRMPVGTLPTRPKGVLGQASAGCSGQMHRGNKWSKDA